MRKISHKQAAAKFEKRFVNDDTELLFLTLENVSGGIILADDLICPSIEFVASVNLITGEFSKKKGRLEWLVVDYPDRVNWGYDFQKYCIYHIKGKRCIDAELEDNMYKSFSNCYRITEVIEDGKSDPRLERIKATYLKPVCLEDPEIGTFLLNRELSWFEGSVVWLDRMCKVFLFTDRENGKTANKAILHLKTMATELEYWDTAFRQYAAHSLIEQVNEWLDKDDHISETAFAESLTISEISITPRGELTAYYKENTGIFEGHTIEVTATISQKFECADIVG